MTVAYDLCPTVDGAALQPACPGAKPRSEPRLFLVPPPAAPVPARPGRLAAPVTSPFDDIAVLRPPVDAPPLHLTRRGVVVVAIATALLAAGLIVLAALSAAAAGAGGAHAASGAGPAAVTVHSGDTLWSIASAAAPQADPRAEVATIARLNHLSGESIVPGQRLRLR